MQRRINSLARAAVVTASLIGICYATPKLQHQDMAYGEISAQIEQSKVLRNIDHSSVQALIRKDPAKLLSDQDGAVDKNISTLEAQRDYIGNIKGYDLIGFASAASLMLIVVTL